MFLSARETKWRASCAGTQLIFVSAPWLRVRASTRGGRHQGKPGILHHPAKRVDLGARLGQVPRSNPLNLTEPIGFMNSILDRVVIRKVSLFSILVAAPALPLSSQGIGDYMNVESPQVSPIALTTVTNLQVGSQKVLLVCNTPDNSVEVWSTQEPPVQLFRLSVGLEPVSVTAEPDGNRFWTANFLGDSATAARLVLVSTNPLKITANIEKIGNIGNEDVGDVGDEPMDIAFHAGTNTIFVTLH